jgi:hypothetical protein
MKTNNFKNDAIEQLIQAKLQINNFNHSFEYKGQMYFKLLPGDKTDLNTSVKFFDSARKEREINLKKWHEENPKLNYPPVELVEHENDCLKNTVTLHIKFENGQYHLPANTYFIDEVIKGLKGKQIAKFNKYSEFERSEYIKSDFKPLGTIKQSELAVIKTVSKFTDNNEVLSSQMNCICINNSYIYGSDSHKLIRRPIDCKMNILINQTGQKFINSCKSDIQVGQSESELKFTCNDKNIIISKCNEKYPIEGADSFYKEKYELTASVDRKALIETIKQVSIYANQASNLIRFNFSNESGLIVSGQDIDFSIDSHKRLNVKNLTFTGEIGFKSQFVLQILQTSQTEFVEFALKSSSHAAFINDILIMPMMLTGETGNSLTRVKNEVEKSDLFEIDKIFWQKNRDNVCSDVYHYHLILQYDLNIHLELVNIRKKLLGVSKGEDISSIWLSKNAINELSKLTNKDRTFDKKRILNIVKNWVCSGKLPEYSFEHKGKNSLDLLDYQKFAAKNIVKDDIEKIEIKKDKLESQLLKEKLRLHSRVASIHGTGYKNGMSISFEKETKLTEQIEQLTAEIEKKQETAKYLAGNKKGYCWGRKTYADEKRENELFNLRFKLNNLKASEAIKEEIKPEPIKPKAVSTGCNEKKLNKLIQMKKRHDFLFTSELKYLQKYASL